MERARLLTRRGELRKEAARLEAALAAVKAEEAGVAQRLGHCDVVEAAGGPEEWRDWAGGLPDEVLAKVASTLIAQTEAGWAAKLMEWDWSEEEIQEEMEERKRDGNCCLFVFALVCRGWRKAQLKVGGPLRTRVYSDVAMPGQVALVKWALAEGCPRDGGYGYTMAKVAAELGHLELVKWLCGEGGFGMDKRLLRLAARAGNLELVQWVRGEGFSDEGACEFAAKGGQLEVLQWLVADGCAWDAETCFAAVDYGQVEVLRWARENGCPWTAENRDWAAAKLGYTDDLGNLVDGAGNPLQ